MADWPRPRWSSTAVVVGAAPSIAGRCPSRARRKAVWTNASFLIYAGGLVVLLGGRRARVPPRNTVPRRTPAGRSSCSQCSTGWRTRSDAGALARGRHLRLRVRDRLGGVRRRLWTWFGWVSTRSRSAFDGFSLGAPLARAPRPGRRRRRPASLPVPVHRAIIVFVGWFFVTDLVSNGGDWSAWSRCSSASSYRRGGGREPTAVRVLAHLAAGVLVGGALLYWWHSATGLGARRGRALVFVAPRRSRPGARAGACSRLSG